MANAIVCVFSWIFIIYNLGKETIIVFLTSSKSIGKNARKVQRVRRMEVKVMEKRYQN